VKAPIPFDISILNRVRFDTVIREGIVELIDESSRPFHAFREGIREDMLIAGA